MIRAPVSVGVRRGPPPVSVGAMVSISQSHFAYLWLFKDKEIIFLVL